MSAEPSAPALLGGRLVFDHSSESDSAVADGLHDTLFPSEEPTDRRRPLYGQRTGAGSPASSGGSGEDGGGGGGSAREPEGGGGNGAVVSAEPWVEEARR